MMSFKTPLGLLLLAMLAMVAESGNEGSYKYDLSNKSDLNKLYNSKVYMAELFTRPSAFRGMVSQAVRVTLEDGSKWLIQKEINFGNPSQPVIEDGRQMSSSWKLKEQKDLNGSKTVSDFMKAGGADFKLL
ncbi:mucin-2-like isoform X2 [Labeo rohita]|uniref:Mucin-2-like isoform X2 n=1 Tax=Labeo rohita TaxID=84645 RepID=A0A498NJ53_LABRO|nr:mucin-2-like isoform X2 [Labeo rohita]